MLTLSIIGLCVIICLITTVIYKKWQVSVLLTEVQEELKTLPKEATPFHFLDDIHGDLIHDVFIESMKAFPKYKNLYKLYTRILELSAFYSGAFLVHEDLKTRKINLDKLRKKLYFKHEIVEELSDKAGLKTITKKGLDNMIKVHEEEMENVLIKCEYDKKYNYYKFIEDCYIIRDGFMLIDQILDTNEALARKKITK